MIKRLKLSFKPVIRDETETFPTEDNLDFYFKINGTYEGTEALPIEKIDGTKVIKPYNEKDPYCYLNDISNLELKENEYLKMESNSTQYYLPAQAADLLMMCSLNNIYKKIHITHNGESLTLTNILPIEITKVVTNFIDTAYIEYDIDPIIDDSYNFNFNGLYFNICVYSLEPDQIDKLNDQINKVLYSYA